MKHNNLNKKSKVNEGVVSNLGKGIAGAVRSGQSFSGGYQKGQGQDQVNKAAQPWIKQWNMTVGRYPQGNTLDNLRNYATNMAGRISGSSADAPDPAAAGIIVDPATDQIKDQKSVNKYITQVVGQAMNANATGGRTSAPQTSGSLGQSALSSFASGAGLRDVANASNAYRQTQTTDQTVPLFQVDSDSTTPSSTTTTPSAATAPSTTNTPIDTNDFLKLSVEQIKQLLQTYKKTKALPALGITAESKQHLREQIVLLKKLIMLENTELEYQQFRKKIYAALK